MDQLRDESHDTYWQSDGPQPHLVNIQFHRKTTIEDVCIYADYKSDESYTPNRSVIVQCHVSFDLTIKKIEFREKKIIYFRSHLLYLWQSMYAAHFLLLKLNIQHSLSDMI